MPAAWYFPKPLTTRIWCGSPPAQPRLFACTSMPKGGYTMLPQLDGASYFSAARDLASDHVAMTVPAAFAATAHVQVKIYTFLPVSFPAVLLPTLGHVRPCSHARLLRLAYCRSTHLPIALVDNSRLPALAQLRALTLILISHDNTLATTQWRLSPRSQ